MATWKCVPQSMSMRTDWCSIDIKGVYLVCIWYVIMTRSGVCWIMLHSEFSTWVSKLCWSSAGASWLLRALRDVSDESLLAKYLLLLLLPASQREFCISHYSESVVPLSRSVKSFLSMKNLMILLIFTVKLLTECVKRKFYADVCFPCYQCVMWRFHWSQILILIRGSQTPLTQTQRHWSPSLTWHPPAAACQAAHWM